MQYHTKTVDEYINAIPPEQKEPVIRLREAVSGNIPEGFSEEMSYGMIGYVVPLDRYPAGYHTTPGLPLPFINIAAQKNYIALYHMGLYSNPGLLNWFLDEYGKILKKKPDMGKGCIRFKNYQAIPYELIGKLAGKIGVAEWVDYYQAAHGATQKVKSGK